MKDIPELLKQFLALDSTNAKLNFMFDVVLELCRENKELKDKINKMEKNQYD